VQQILQRLAEPLLCRVKAYGRSVFCIGASPVALPCLKTSGDRYSRRDQALSSELRRFRQKSGGAAASGRVGTQLVISCGIFRSGLITRPDLAPSRRLARTVHITPAKLAIDGLRGTGHLQSASGNVAVPRLRFTVICPPVGLQVEAAQSAKISVANMGVVSFLTSVRSRRQRRKYEEQGGGRILSLRACCRVPLVVVSPIFVPPHYG